MNLIDKLALLHIVDRKVLFVRSKGKDVFFTVGGKRDPGETDAQTLVREAQEELGVDVDPSSMRHFHTFSDTVHDRPGVELKLTCYFATFSGTPRPCSEIEEMAWLNSTSSEKITRTGKMVIELLRAQDLID